MNILIEEEGKWVMAEESAITWMQPKPDTEHCPLCTNELWLKIGTINKACSGCGAQFKIKLGDLI